MSESPVEFLYRALDSKLGIVVKTSNPEQTRQRLYAARRAAQNPDFAKLSICPSRANPSSELWIVRKSSAEGTQDE